MKSSKQRKKEIQAKRVHKKESLLSNGMKKQQILIDPSRLSEKSQRSLGIPEYYIDEIIKCTDCDVSFLFSAIEQKEWYEHKKVYFWQRPIRCEFHYHEWLRIKKMKKEMDRNLAILESEPDNKKLMNICADSITEYHKGTQNGNIKKAMELYNKLNLKNDNYLYCKKQS